MFSNFRSDLKRYKSNGKFHFEEPSIYVIALYRSGHLIRNIHFFPFKLILSIIHLPFYIAFSMLTGIHIPRGCTIGPGLRIYHYGCIVLNPETKIGSNCTIRHDVTIGTRKGDHDVPSIGDNVNIGTGARILGAIKIGNNVSIGANAVVVNDVPDYSTVVGVPARVIIHEK